ncbi:hypothetical protein I305_06225 [Cryptococcus gattii E566]|uniref:Uncharacterized protein n=2 Tax=Cryptococcus gattii TaxID=37769 RepID=E6R164_CRYGW|nr:Hypothetical protein CGB_B6330W [Cryptococcus gattii WM276]ADV20546.1 Hypothetical protein CGB_B6330W [Cryptococcus gattii WM276]KIR76944.1 hypothetical protein I306_06096 [Cryptococcus gattii EJB2]KIY31320.1 hypothetical protein I305_06225 [Cryptococcus gattii E566]KJE01655.1 hypothetical protein I311_04692 [Cryptococcus gattii NT-10]
MSPLTPESINSGYIIPTCDHRLSCASSSASNIQPSNTNVDSCYSRFVRSFAGSASLFPNSRLLPDPRPIARSTLKKQEPSPSPTPSFHMDKDISAMTQPPVSIKLHRELLITGEPRGDSISPQYHIEQSPPPEQNSDVNHVDRQLQYLVDPRLKLYPFVLPPNLWEEPTSEGMVQSDQEIQQASRSIVPLSLSTLNVPINRHSTYSPSQSPPSPSTSVTPRIIQNPHFSDPRVGKHHIPSALLNRPLNESLHLSSLIPYPGEPKGGCIIVRNYQGKLRSCYGIEAEDAVMRRKKVAILQMSSTHTPSMMTSKKARVHPRTALVKRIPSQEAELRAQVARTLIPRGHGTQRGPRGPRMRSKIVEGRA